MIPFAYRLREGVRVEEGPTGWLVVSELPLGVLRVNRAAAEMLERMRDGVGVTDLAAAASIEEERVLALCEHFRRRGILDVLQAFGCPDPSASHPAQWPSVSVIVPTKDRAVQLEACLESLFAVDYPRDEFEVIVIDDGSSDRTPEVVAEYPCRYLANERNRGQSYSRNEGARLALGELLAFIDSDCVASRGWLKDLTPVFAWPRVAAVGGLVSGHSESSRLDRYEQVASSLNMGDRLVFMTDDDSMAYMPTCNLLVRRSVYAEVGGLREDLRVGEDVDLCWRMRAAGHWLVYTPGGEVEHRHRDRLAAMLRRRAAYGTSEALLHALHPDKRKTFSVRVLPALSAALVVAAALCREPRLLPVSLVVGAVDGTRSRRRLAAAGVRVRADTAWLSALRGHLSFLYSVSFHLVRYYLLPLAAAGIFLPGCWLLAAAAAAYVTAVDFRVKRPELSYPAFAGFSLAEHTAYQVGVVAGCVRMRSFRSYAIRFRLPERAGRRASGLGAPAG